MAALALPFLRKSAMADAGDAQFEVAVYRDQLQELERDRARGIIGDAESQAAGNEISRRLLNAAPQEAPARGHSSALGRSTILLVPLIALPLYAYYGNPKISDVPLQVRLQGAIVNQDFAALVASVETHLASDPNDLKGWQVLAPAYKHEKRWSDAAEAYANILRLAPASGENIADYAEMLVFDSEGMVTAEAHKAFLEALKIDPRNPRGRYFHALAVKQEGKTEEARKLFEAFLADSPANAAWRPMVEREIRDLSGAKVPAPSNEQVAQVQAMSAGDQAAMIKNMMDGLEKKLGTDSRDLNGWLRLIRARVVSDDMEKARASLQTARNIFKDEPSSLESLAGLAKELEIN